MTRANRSRLPPAYLALQAALLFGASTPAAKMLVGQIQPQLLAGLLYLGSGIGLAILNIASSSLHRSKPKLELKKSALPWLAAAILCGGVIAPVLLMLGLRSTGGGPASLLLNLEAVFTAGLAWFLFKEHFDRRIFLGMMAIVLGSIVLTWQPDSPQVISQGSLAIIASCLCWAFDNNLTRHVSDADPVQIAATKGLAAGLINCLIAIFCGASLPAFATAGKAMLIGFFGYGVSLVLFIKALRHLGTARTGAYFSTAPFAGACISLAILHEHLTVNLIAAAALMAIGVWLHLSESHVHEHSHDKEEHEHSHWHDEHHQHDHEPGVSAGEPHSHWHSHLPIKHSHQHYPDTEHRHDH